MTTESLAARLESGWCPIESPADMERAAAELRRLSAVEAERDELKLAFAHTVRLVQDWTQSAYAMEAERDAMRLDYSRLLEKHNNLHANAARDRAERDAVLETFAKVCARLNIDTEAARKLPGKPSDVLIGAIDAEQDALKVALECERMRLVACGVVACSDTPKSAAVARDMLPVYRSAACDDVARRVDECISLRAERDALRAALADAAQSLETIAKNAGKKLDSEGQENMLAHHDQVRGYANSRAGAARAAMKGTK